jgi:hypothetical protein
MKIEIVEFYPDDKQSPKTLKGSLHIYLCEEHLDVRGVVVFKNAQGKWYFEIPYRWGKDTETGKLCRFPIINFTSKRKNQDLMKSIIKLAPKYIDDLMKK